MKKKFVMIFVMILFSLSMIGGGTFLICNNLITETPNSSESPENSGGGDFETPEENLFANGSTGHDFTIDIYVLNLESSYYKSTVSPDNSTIASMCCFDIYWYCADGSTGNLTSTSETYTLISSYSQTWTSSSTSSKTNKTGLIYAQYKYTNSSKTYKRYAKVVPHINSGAVEQQSFLASGGQIISGSKSAYYIYGSGYITDSESVAQSNCTAFLTGSYSLYFNQTMALHFYGYLNSNSTSMSSLISIWGYDITIPTYSDYGYYTPLGYTFSGWRNRNNLRLYQSGDIVKPHNIYDSSGGNWERFDADFAPNVYEITLDSTYRSSSSEISGTVVDSSGTGTIYEKYENGFYSDKACSSKIETITTPTKTGYTFQGYYTERAGTGTKVIDKNGKITANNYKWTEDSFIFAHYTINTYILTIFYNCQCVTDETTIKVSQSSCTVTDNYSTTGSISDGIIGCGSIGSTSTTYYARVSHTYSTSSYDITIARQNTNYNYYMDATTYSSTVLETLPNTNSIITTWTPTSAAEIYVDVYQQYTITYNGNGYTSGTVPSTQYKIHGTSTTLASNGLTKTNYSANGWNTATAYKATPSYTSSSTYSTNANLTLYANFVPNTCSVTIELLTVSKDGSMVENSTTGGTVSVTSTVYNTSSSTLVTTQTVSITSASATQTVQKNQVMTFTPTPTSGYVFCGVSSNDFSLFNRVANNSWTPTSSITLYVHFRELSNNLLKYDSTNNYYYFEDGYMPQTYAEMISSGLNATITSNGTRLGTYSLENGTSYQLASYDEYYYLGFTAPKTMSLALESYTTSGTYSFTKGTWYWFRFEPIRWRVSFVDCQNGGYLGMYITNYTVVSDLVLWYDCMDTNENHKEGDKAYDMTFTSSLRDGNFETMLSTFTNSYSNGKLQFSGSISAEWQKFGEVGQANPVQVDTTHTTSDYELINVNKYTSGNTSSLRVASTDEISDTIGNTKAKASCLVAFLMGSSNTQYSKYWTRDLGNNLNAGKVVAQNGLTRSEWLTNSNGIRFAYTMSEGSRGNL